MRDVCSAVTKLVMKIMKRRGLTVMQALDMLMNDPKTLHKNLLSNTSKKLFLSIKYISIFFQNIIYLSTPPP